MSVQEFVDDRPLSFIAMLAGLKDMILGFGFVAGIEHVKNTQLYAHYDVLLPGVAGPIMGVVFFIVGLLVTIFSIKGNRKLTNRSLNAQAFMWLFSTLSYLLYGQFIFAVILGLFFAVLSGYLASLDSDRFGVVD